jgi:GNAT superfamily N-acetyltransferase
VNKDKDEVTLRPVRADDDLDALNEGAPDWLGSELHNNAFAADPGPHRGRWIAEIDGLPVGFAHCIAKGIAGGNRAVALVFVRPEHRARGAGRLLWQQVLEVCTPDRVPGIVLPSDADDLSSKEIALSHGLHLGPQHVRSRLDLTAFAPPASLRRERTDGIALRPLSPDLDEAGWLSFADYFNGLMADAPDSEGGAEPMPYGFMRAALPETWQVLVAWDGDEMVAFTSLFVRDARARVLETLMTGVNRDYRGRGLSTAVKAAHALAVRDAGWLFIDTENMDVNAPILASNKTLGFERVSAIQDLVYDHQPAAARTGD